MPDLPADSYRDVATVFNPDPTVDEHWDKLADFLAADVVDEGRPPIKHILSIVRSRQCRTVVLEHMYVDRDYLSEYSAFWSSRFVFRPQRAARLHFFAREFDVDSLFDLPADLGYLGYMVLRPTQLGAVGRTVLAPPQELAGPKVRLTAVVDRPSLFGHPLEVRGVPFYQQDGELLRCAHAAAWICHFVAHHRRIVGRRSTAEIARVPSAEGSKHRPLPSTGLTGEQLQGVFSAIGIPAFFYEVSELPRLPADLPEIPGEDKSAYERRLHDERVFRVVCKYLNSGFPVVVLTKEERGNHAFTLVGWEHLGDEGGVRLIACDDQVGPYEIIDSPTLDSERRGEWKALMLPLPQEVFLTGEAAETKARNVVKAERDLAAVENDLAAGDLGDIAPHLDDLRGKVRVRSRLMEGRRYKAMAVRQERHAEAIRVLRMADYPLWVWVVEFQDPDCREAGDPCVLAEMVFDSSSHDDFPSTELIATRSVAMDLGMIGEEDVEELEDDAQEPPEPSGDGAPVAEAAGDEADAPPPEREQAADVVPETEGAAGPANAARPRGAQSDQDSVAGEASEPEPLWLGKTEGRKWRSLVSDPHVSDREYGGEPRPDTPGPPVPPSPEQA